MGQTLTHGVYLPDEGERNCYSGLASNWSILDGAVGTIAEHTTALAGKAPAVHTHTKSDVTDLLNSNFIPSANNSYDLGSSSYQWNNVYAKNYYYNGVAWGLDKANTWTNRNIYENDSITIRDNNIQDTTAPDSDVGKGIFEVWNKDNHYWGGLGYKWLANGNSELIIALSNWNSNTQGYWEYKIGVNKAFNDLYFAPPHNLVNLGTSTNKWKTLNGINPGALSLPKYATAPAQDISGDMIPDAYGNIRINPTLDGWMYVDFNISNATTSDSKMYVQVKDNAIASANYVVNFFAFTGSNHIFVYLPVLKSALVILQVNFTGFSIGKGYIYPCQGNV